ncbi:MAG: SDR family oxidoreductase [Planctomycetes bacterium]|nr:SDR family oxidoreductase [Planctomycetota bacterium]
MDFGLQGKHAMVVGGGRGIGKSIARELAREGADVVIASRTLSELEGTARELEDETGQRITPLTLDVTQREQVDPAVAAANEKLGGLHILVNSAGVNIRDRSMALTTPDAWDQLMAINATGAFNCMQAVLPAMRERRDGLIVNISSIAGKRASMLGGLAYSASKFAMTALGTAVALENGHLGIRVSNVYPGEVNTPILDGRPVKVSDEHRAQILQKEDCGAAVLMIACLPPRAHVAELVIKPTTQDYA